MKMITNNCIEIIRYLRFDKSKLKNSPKLYSYSFDQENFELYESTEITNFTSQLHTMMKLSTMLNKKWNNQPKL